MKTQTRIQGVLLSAILPFTSMPVAWGDLAPPSASVDSTTAGSNALSSIALRWTADPSVVLQRSASLENPVWETLEDTLGQSEFREDVSGKAPAFYRLAKFAPDSEFLTSREWESRLSTIVAERIREATLPPASRGKSGETIPSENPEKKPPAEIAPYTWVSQPGMMRGYGADKAFREAWPLYSSSKSKFTSSQDLAEEMRCSPLFRPLEAVFNLFLGSVFIPF